MKLIKTVLVVIFFMFLISAFMLNKNVEMKVSYFGLSQPATVQFWELVTVCVALGVIVSALWDFFSELKWLREKRKMIQTHKEHRTVEGRLNARIEELEAENLGLKSEIERLSMGSGSSRAPSGLGPATAGATPSGFGAKPSAGDKPMTGQASPTPSVTSPSAASKGSAVAQAGSERGSSLSATGRGLTPAASASPVSPAVKSTGAPSESAEKKEVPKKTGFLARFSRSSSKESQDKPGSTKAPTLSETLTDKPSGPTGSTEEAPTEKKPGLFARFGTGVEKPEASGTGEDSTLSKPAAATPTTPSKTDPKPGPTTEKGSTDKPKGEKDG